MMHPDVSSLLAEDRHRVRLTRDQPRILPSKRANGQSRFPDALRRATSALLRTISPPPAQKPADLEAHWTA